MKRESKMKKIIPYYTLKPLNIYALTPFAMRPQISRTPLYELAQDWYLHIILENQQRIKVKIPKKFQFDGASIPRFFWRLLGCPHHPQYIRAGALHDYLYATQLLPRKEADLCFLCVLKTDKVNYIPRILMYYAVRIFGGKAYFKN